MFALPMSCYRPTQATAKEFAALPYDVFDRESAKAYCKKHPKSFLTIDRAEVNFSDDHDMYADDVYEKARKLLVAAETDGRLIYDGDACYYLYELTQEGRTQTGIVSAVAVSDYVDGIICRHENTTRKKEEDRVRHIQATKAQTGPIFLAYRPNKDLKKCVAKAKEAAPIISFTDDAGVLQRIWRISERKHVQALYQAFLALDRAYIADGHHRCASAVRVSLELGVKRSGAPDVNDALTHPAAYFLAVLFDADELHILPYNRLVLDSLGKSPKELLQQIAECEAHISAKGAEFFDPASGHVAMYLDKSWYDIELPAATDTSVSAKLDTQRLQQNILGPIFGIDDPRDSARIRFVGGATSVVELMRMTDEVSLSNSSQDLGTAVAFYMSATTCEQLMAVSDAEELMPPKSTWFEPKLRSGLFVRHLS